jgi:WD40 repeat protein
LAAFQDPNDRQTVCVWDLKALALRKALTGLSPGRLVATIVFSPDNSLVAVEEHGGFLTIWEIDTANRLATLPLGNRLTSPDPLASNGLLVMNRSWNLPGVNENRNLVRGQLSNPPSLWGGNGRFLATFCRRQCSRVRYAPDGSEIGSVGFQVPAVNVWQILPACSYAGHPGEKAAISALKFCPDGKSLTANGSVWDVVSRSGGMALKPAPRKGLAEAPPPCRHGKFELRIGKAQTNYGPDLELWDLAAGKRLQVWPYLGAGRASFSRDGNQILLAGRGGVKIVDSATGKTIHYWTTAITTVSKMGKTTRWGSESAWDAIYSADGKTVFWCTVGCVAHEDIETDRQLQSWESPGLRGNRLVLSPDGAVLAFWGGGQVCLWDLTNNQELAHWLAHDPGAMTSLAFSPDGRLLASGGADGSLKLWDLSLIRSTLAALSQPPPEDPRLVRPLPWVRRPTRAGFHILPSVRLAMPITWVPTDPTFSAPQLIAISLFLAGVGMALYKRRWRWLVFLVAFWLMASLFVAGHSLVIDADWQDPDEHYSWKGWYVVLIDQAATTGVFMALSGCFWLLGWGCRRLVFRSVQGSAKKCRAVLQAPS